MDTLGVVERAHSLAQLVPEAELDLLVAGAYLHDVGYAPALAYTGFHPLDGAVFLRSLSRDRLACLVAHHSGARAEAEARGLARELDEFAEEQSRVADALTYCDLVTVSDGAPTAPAVRLSHVIAPYGSDHPVGRTVIRSRDDDMLTRVRAVDAWSDRHPRPSSRAGPDTADKRQ
jgi:hypothetical protein